MFQDIRKSIGKFIKRKPRGEEKKADAKIKKGGSEPLIKSGSKDTGGTIVKSTPSRNRTGPSEKSQRKRKAPVKSSPRKGEDADWKKGASSVPEVSDKTRFYDLDLPDPVLHALMDLGFHYCTPIQAEILPSTLERKDATGRAQTGTGKTAAFLITALTWMLKNRIDGKRTKGTPRVLIIAPTRELVLQIEAEACALAKYCPFKIMSVFGGMDYEKQRRRLKETLIDVVVATPGRLLDFKRRRDINLKKVEIMVLDEADRMLDMGFIPDVRNIIYSIPPKAKRQTLLFSATLTPEVTRLVSQWTRDPVVVEIEPEHVAVDTVDQVVFIVTTAEKYALLYNVITRQNLKRVLVFCNRRDETRKLAGLLRRYRINCALLSGEIPQKQRIRTLENFKSGKIRVLVATDVAGRGIHVEGISHVINYTLPQNPEDYVHRIGRTGRAGAMGTSVSFACEEDSFYIPDIEKYTGQKLNCIYPDDEWLKLPPLPKRSLDSNDKRAPSVNRRRRPGRGRTKTYGKGQKPRKV
ncbi:DEAD/DEAH box helicase [Thermodesulfobacteriota bacterium]